MDYLKYFATGELPDLRVLKATSLQAGQPRASYGRHERLEDQLAMLADEFSSRSALEFLHAGTIVHIRRNIHRDAHADRFQWLWREESAYLLNVLNLRWLVSACDTIVDVSSDPADRAAAALGTVLANTVKLYETERLACSSADPDYSNVQGLVPLFDGLTAFNVGKGDMVFQLLARLDSLTRDGLTPGQLLAREIVQRVNRSDTVFRRFAVDHVVPETAWRALS